MKEFRLTRPLFILILFLIVACAQQEVTHVPTAGGPLPEVATSVAQTLAAINPTATPNSTPTNTPTPTHSLLLSATPTATAILSPTPTLALTPTGQATPTATPTGIPSAKAVPATSACIDKAGFFADVTFPDNTLLQKNQAFIKTWRFRNEGTCTWGEGYLLVFANGHIMGGSPSSPLPKAAPGDLIDVSVNLKAPADGGTYAGDWQFQNAAGMRFGVNSHGEDYFWVKIRVDWGPGVGPTATPPPIACSYQHSSSDDAQILQLINAARSARGLPALIMQNQLSAAALAHSADMACNNYLDHTGSDGTSYDARIRAAGYKPVYDSENIYAGGSPQDAFDWWMNSQIHRDNILSSKITQIGIAAVTYPKSNFGTYYTLDFGRP